MTFILALTLALTTPCATEDSSNCFYDASTRGNGIGMSLIDVQGTAYLFDSLNLR